MGHEIISGFSSLFIVREVGDVPEVNRRSLNGDLDCPPEMYVIVPDHYNSGYSIEPVTFGAAKVLAPSDFKSLTDKLALARKREFDDWNARLKGEADTAPR